MEPDGWRGRTLERSLRTARERAMSRSERFITVATELLYETGNLDFTVQDLVERSGLSLRSFYQQFASKDELLLAVLEEAIRSYVSNLRERVEAEADPVRRLEMYVTEFFDAGQKSNRRASAALSRYLLTLTGAEPAELARVLAPQVDLLSEIIAAGCRAGRFRTDLAVPVLTNLVTQTIMSAVEMDVLGSHLTGASYHADELWAFVAGGVGVVPADAGEETSLAAGGTRGAGGRKAQRPAARASSANSSIT